jgi:hypothetical protein
MCFLSELHRGLSCPKISRFLTLRPGAKLFFFLKICGKSILKKREKFLALTIFEIVFNTRVENSLSGKIKNHLFDNKKAMLIGRRLF